MVDNGSFCQDIACFAMPFRKWRLPNQSLCVKKQMSPGRECEATTLKRSSSAAEELALTHSPVQCLSKDCYCGVCESSE